MYGRDFPVQKINISFQRYKEIGQVYWWGALDKKSPGVETPGLTETNRL